MNAPTLDWKNFLEAHPPESAAVVKNAVDTRYTTGPVLTTSPVQLHCDSLECEGIHWFDHITGDVHLERKKWTKGIAVYCCRHCKRTTKVFALYAKLADDTKSVTAYKLGEYPPFGPHTPSRVISLIGPDKELFLKGRRAENRGLGIGAFAYYRRVVENQKNRIIDEMEKVARKVGAKPEAISRFDSARAENQFSKAVDDIKDGIPESLLIDGHNPLKLLHTALSKGIHTEDDNTCLALAQSIRLVLTELAEKLSVALKEHAELKDAVSRLLQQNSKKD